MIGRPSLRSPGFWQKGRGRVLQRLLTPFAAATARATAARIARPGWRAPVPVICCGNVVVGGAGKTTLALDLAHRLQTAGVAVHLISRGYGGHGRGVIRVDPDRHDARLVGDEPLLLAARAPTWVAADRAAAAREAVAQGAEALVMDDGLQNPSLAKDLSLLVIDGRTGFGNGRVLPAGPLREPVAAGAARCEAAVLIGEDATGARDALPPGLPVLQADLRPDPRITELRGRTIVAFAGIASPQKFFATLDAAGLKTVARFSFPDHYRFSEASLAPVQRAAEGAVLVTTAKDAVRLPPGWRDKVVIVEVALAWRDPPAITALLAGVCAAVGQA